MNNIKKTELRIEREKQGLSIFKLSNLSGVSFEKTRQLDMGYRVEGTRIEIKEKIAKALTVLIWELFPDVRNMLTKWAKELKLNILKESK